MRRMLPKGMAIVAFLLILYASYLLILLSLPYIHLIPGVEFLATKQLIYHIKVWRMSFYIHVFSSAAIILSGLFQFNRFVIHRKVRLHRILGYTYVVTVLLISGPAALVMSLYANGGWRSQTSFVILSVLWIFTTAFALRCVFRKQYERHGNWLLRSYALTLSAVTLRFYAYLFDVWRIDIPPRETYILLAWASWVPNLIFAEVLIRLGYVRFLLKAPVQK
jgi:hypothetical protein